MSSLGEVGEFGLIAAIALATRAGNGVEIGIGDDAALIALPSGKALVTTDMAIEGVHFRTDWSSAYEIGRKCAAANLADIAAMGGRTRALVVAFAAPASLSTEWALQLTQGINDECEEEGASVVGGDTVRGEAITISITAIGEVASPVTRAGAQVGDIVYLLGQTGASAAGLEILTRGMSSPTGLVALHKVPKPPYELAREFANLGATSMCDVSDGLVADLAHIADASGVTIDINLDALDISILLTAAEELEMDPLEWVLSGGEDHAFVGTLSAGQNPPPAARAIGVVCTRSDSAIISAGVAMHSHGHDHFSA
ncbi:MAG: thiamine-phosphate kinase [Actinobacteria bacterium]|nr:MAG: thiamine-phosphate kinase [Actinomycetota bacterium]